METRGLSLILSPLHPVYLGKRIIIIFFFFNKFSLINILFFLINILFAGYSYRSSISEGMRKIDRLFAAVAEGDIRLASYYLGLEGPCSKTYVSELDEPKFCHPLCHCDKCVSLEELSYEKETKPPIAINAVNSRGETALHIASAVGSTEIIQVCDPPLFILIF